MTRTVLVTGGSRGLGATIVKTLAKQGFQVVINYYQSEDAAKELVSEIGTDHALAVQADVTNREEVEHLIKTATDHFGHIDVVINNALVGFKFEPDAQKSFKDLSWDDYQKQIDSTLKAAFNLEQYVITIYFERKTRSI